MMKKRNVFGALLTVLSCIFLIVFTLGIRGDNGGKGWFFVFFIILLIPALVNIYALLKKKRNIKIAATCLGIIVIVCSMITIYIADKPIHTEIYDVFFNIKTIYFGYILYIIGDVLSYI